jgi:putative colanic acid biosynthesis acetyltransferase WcaF
MRLEQYSSQAFDRGRPRWVEALWMVVQWLFVSSALPGSWHRTTLLRLFGARIGSNVVMKPRILVKFPWRLQVGAWSWIGEAAWIDNLANVAIGANVVLSQGVYVCTGSHDIRSDSFDLIVREVLVEDGAWICAHAIVAPGTVVKGGAVLSAGSVATGVLQPGMVYRGNPAVPCGPRNGTAAEAGPRDEAGRGGALA